MGTKSKSEIPARLNELLERGEISPEAYAEYAATADAHSGFRAEATTFDHVTLRVDDLPAARSAFAALLDQLEIEQTASTPSFSVWGNFALTQTDEEHPIAERVHIAFIAPTPGSSRSLLAGRHRRGLHR